MGSAGARGSNGGGRRQPTPAGWSVTRSSDARDSSSVGTALAITSREPGPWPLKSRVEKVSR